MPFLSFDLDGKKRAARAARAVGVEPGVVAWGLLELWEHSWASKTDVASEMVLDGCFGPNPRIREALVAYEFLEPVEKGWRVRGAAKYLGLTEAKVEAGRARAASSSRDARGRLLSSSPQQPSSTHPAAAGQPSSSHPALTPITHHPSPNREEEEAPKPKTGAPEFLWAQVERETVHGLIAELDLDPPGNSAFIAEVQELSGGRFKATYAAFLFDPYWTKQRSKWAGFRKKWRDFVPPAEPAPPPELACKACSRPITGRGTELCSSCSFAWQDSEEYQIARAGDGGVWETQFDAWVSGRKQVAA